MTTRSLLVVPTSDAHRAIDAVWRIESARLIAGLARLVRDVGLAEDLAQDALVAALEQWPQSGVPAVSSVNTMSTGSATVFALVPSGAMTCRLISRRRTVTLGSPDESVAPDKIAA
jgi:hypothetical protein